LKDTLVFLVEAYFKLVLGYFSEIGHYKVDFCSVYIELCWIRLCRHFDLSDPISEVANMLDNLCMKPGDKISTYNMDFMCYVSQLG